MAGWRTAIALAGALLMVCLNAVGDSSSSFVATNLQWKGAAVITVSGPLMDLRLPEGSDDAGFQMSAAHVRIETHSQRKIVVRPAASTATEPAETRVDEFDDWNSGWTAGPGAGLFLQSGHDAVLSAAATAGAISIPATDCLAEPTYFTTGQPANCPDLATAVSIASDSSSWSLAGNFTLSLWQWESVGDPGLWGGARPTHAGRDGFGEQEYRLVHLFVTQGALQFTGAQNLSMFAGSATLSSAPGTAIATGGGDVGLAGRRTLEIGRVPQGLQAQAIALESQEAPWSSHAAWSALGLIGLVTVPSAVLVVRRRSAAMHMLNASHSMMIGNYEAAVSHALDARRHGRYRREASLVASIGMLHAGDLDNAGRFIESLSGTLDRAAIAYLLAILRAIQGRSAEAQALLQECGRLDPMLQSEIDANPLFATILGNGGGAGYQ